MSASLVLTLSGGDAAAQPRESGSAVSRKLLQGKLKHFNKLSPLQFAPPMVEGRNLRSGSQRVPDFQLMFDRTIRLQAHPTCVLSVSPFFACLFDLSNDEWRPLGVASKRASLLPCHWFPNQSFSPRRRPRYHLMPGGLHRVHLRWPDPGGARAIPDRPAMLPGEYLPGPSERGAQYVRQAPDRFTDADPDPDKDTQAEPYPERFSRWADKPLG